MAPASLDLIVPVYNEEEFIEPCARAFLGVLRGIEPSLSVRLIFVDDGSSDGSWERIQSLVDEGRGGISGVRLLRNFGKESAIAAGLHAARADLVAVADCDLEHPPAVLKEMVQIALREWPRVDVVEAVREARLMRGWASAIGAKCFYGLLRRFSALDLEGHTDFKVLSRRVIQAYLTTPEKAKFFKGFVAWLRPPSIRVPFTPERTRDVGRWSLSSLVRYAGQNLLGYSSLAFAAGLLISGLAALLGLTATAKALYDFLSGEAEVGFSSVIALLFFLHTASFLLLTLVLAVLGRVLDEAQGRPRFVVDVQADGPESSPAEKQP